MAVARGDRRSPRPPRRGAAPLLEQSLKILATCCHCGFNGIQYHIWPAGGDVVRTALGDDKFTLRGLSRQPAQYFMTGGLQAVHRGAVIVDPASRPSPVARAEAMSSKAMLFL